MENFDIMRLDGHALKVFLSVCQTGSVSRTAELFDLNQSTISHTLDKVRAAIGDPLFVKAGRGITPTEAALALVPRIENLLVDLESMASADTYDITKELGRFIVAISTPALLKDVKLFQSRIKQSAPNAQFELRRLAPRNRITQILDEQEAELAIAVSGFKYPSTLNHFTYGYDELVVFYDPGHRGPVYTLDEYIEASHGVVNFGGNVKSVVETELAERGRSRNISLVSPTASMLGDLIKGTDIITTMPKRLADRVYNGLWYCPVPFALPFVTYDVVWHRRLEHSGRHVWLRNMVKNIGHSLYGDLSKPKNP